ncbi:MAG TPA: putative molybdenum carrier protein [Longimicrobiaceae bacterium]
MSAAGVPETVVSGGQTGVDRAALDAAAELGIACGGWCPAGRRAEDGAVPARYPLRETPSADPAERTTWNVRDSDGTLVLTAGPLSGGTTLAIQAAHDLRRPLLVVELPAGDPEHVRRWIADREIRTLNVAGPRETERPGIGRMAGDFLREVLGEGQEGQGG